jgi:hypothetical protein
MQQIGKNKIIDVLQLGDYGKILLTQSKETGRINSMKLSSIEYVIKFEYFDFFLK